MRYTFKIENNNLICICHDTNEFSNNFDTYIKSLKFVNKKISNLDKYNYETVTFKNNCIYLKDNNDNVVKFVNFGELIFKYHIHKYLKNNFSKIKQAIFNYQKNKITKQLPKNLELNKGRIILAGTILGILCGSKMLYDASLNNDEAIEIENEDQDLEENNEIVYINNNQAITNESNIIKNKKIIETKNEVIDKSKKNININNQVTPDTLIVEEKNESNYEQIDNNENSELLEPIETNDDNFVYEVENINNDSELTSEIEDTNTNYDNAQIYITSTMIPIDIENNSDDELINNINTNFGDIINECSEKWGISANLITALIRQESNGTEKNLGQIEFRWWHDMVFNAHNFVTDKDEKIVLTNNPDKYPDMITISEEELMNPKTNISMSTIILRYNLERNNYNVPITIQEYNYGCGNMEKVLNAVANKSGITKEDIINDPTNLDFMEYRTLINGGDKNHGDDEYIEHVLQYVDGDIIIKMKDSNNIVYNVEHQKSLSKIK